MPVGAGDAEEPYEATLGLRAGSTGLPVAGVAATPYGGGGLSTPASLFIRNGKRGLAPGGTGGAAAPERAGGRGGAPP